MTVIPRIRSLDQSLASDSSAQLRSLPNLLALGCAVPALSCTQHEVQDMMAELWKLNSVELERWRRIIAGSGIRSRFAVLAPVDVIHLTTAQRMLKYEQFAPPLACQAARVALQESGVQAHDITHVFVVSCTGFIAPGIDVEIVRQLSLKSNVHRTTIGFMGCFGAITGLRAAISACMAHPHAVALVVCVELCSLHMRADKDIQNQVATALFADGAAAAVVAVSSASSIGLKSQICNALGKLSSGASLLLEEGRDWMTWRITDNGFAMTLSREVPNALKDCLKEFVDGACGKMQQTFIIHPGGPGILDAADEALTLRGGRGLEISRSVLNEYGNMSSATVLFVLRDAILQGYPLPATMLAFGPGLTIESLDLLLRDSDVQ